MKLLTDEQLLGTANFLVIAGSETITLTLTAFVYFVASNPKHLSRLKHEIHSAFQAEHEITLKRTEKLEFLNACLKEALRISPAVAGGPPRVVAKGGRIIAGVFVPQDVRPSLSARKPEDELTCCRPLFPFMDTLLRIYAKTFLSRLFFIPRGFWTTRSLMVTSCRLLSLS